MAAKVHRPRVVLAALGLYALSVSASRAHAHPSQPCRAEMSFYSNDIDTTLYLPADDLGLALASAWEDDSLRELADNPEWFDVAFAIRLKLYVAEFFDVRGANGQAYEEHIGVPRWEAADGGVANVVVPVTHAHGGDSSESVTVRASVVTEEVESQRILVLLKYDFAMATFDESVQPIAVLRRWDTETTFDRRDASTWRGFIAAFELGARHIAEGLDHLLFVLVLLLAAPLRQDPSRIRWGKTRSMGTTLRVLATVVTAFTIGHSLTLGLSTIGWANFPSAPIEVLIGVSVALGAINVLLPIFRNREPLVAALFGLIHGLAFADTLQELGLRGSTLALTLAGFNLGIEAVQLLVVVIVAPLLLSITRHVEVYRVLRWALALFALLASGAWTTERLTGKTNPLSAVLEQMAQHPLHVGVTTVATLFVFAAFGAHQSRQRRRAARDAIESSIVGQDRKI